jgi:hypothetical protein
MTFDDRLAGRICGQLAKKKGLTENYWLLRAPVLR